MFFPDKFLTDLKGYPPRHIHFMVVLFLVLLILGVAIPLHQDSPKILLTVPIQGKPIYTPPPVATERATLTWKTASVRSGDNLARIFYRLNLSDTLLANLMNSAPNKNALLKLLPSESFRFGFKDNNLKEIHYIQSPLTRVEITINDQEYIFKEVTREPEVRLTYKQAEVSDSLFLSAMRANINDNLTMEIANIFGGVIDFALDVRPGDTFDVFYETLYLDDQVIDLGNILAVSYTNSGTTHTAYRYTDSKGKTGYFDAKGVSMRKTFLRAPLDFTRISSGFNLRRKHPIHKKIKAHRGTDYAAPRGTPIFAAGDGRITRAGYTKANGNYVVIQHGQNYQTKYLHLNKRHVKIGQRVGQRQIIGTVGSTGYATGPHLHYEFLVNGTHRNPRTILKKLPSADPIKTSERERFLEKVKAVQLQYSNSQAQVL